MAKVEMNSPAPDFRLKDYKGNEFRLKDFRGEKNIVLVFNRGFL